MIEGKMVEDVRKELQKDPIVFESVRRQMLDEFESMKLIQRPIKCFPNDMVTYVGAPDNQRKIVKKLIDKYGAMILADIIPQVYNTVEGSEDWKEEMK